MTAEPHEGTALPGAGPATIVPPVESARHLVAASFDLLMGATEETRRGSFYAGLIALGLIAPFALASWALVVRGTHLTDAEAEALLAGSVGASYGFLIWPALIGTLVVAIESRSMVVSMLGGRLTGRPLTVRQALARSRMVFWRVFAVGAISGVVLSVAQLLADIAIEAVIPIGGEAGLVAVVLAAAVIGAPIAYLLSGVVLGDVAPLESVRRSFLVFRARKLAAAIVAVFETAAFLLVFLGLSAGLDLALRAIDGLGLGVDSGPAGLALVTVGIAALVFALGTLIFTVTAISLAPQVVMFVGLTHATIGLDHVQPGGDGSPDARSPRSRPFLTFTRPLLAGVVLAWAVLLVVVALLLD